MNRDGSFEDRAKRGAMFRILAPSASAWAVCWAITVALGLKVSVVWLGVALVPMLGAPAWIAIANWSSLSLRDREDYGHAWRSGASGAALAIGPLAFVAYGLPFELWLPRGGPADFLVAGALVLLFLQILGFWTVLLHGRARRAFGDNLQ